MSLNDTDYLGFCTIFILGWIKTLISEGFLKDIILEGLLILGNLN